MEKDLILAVDVGTTYLKAGLVDAEGNILRSCRNKIRMDVDPSGKAEHNVKDLSRLLQKTMKKVVDGFEKRVAAIVPSTYIFGLMLLDSNNVPHSNMITLADTRIREVMCDFKGYFDRDFIYSRTGMPPTFHTALAKVFWSLRRLQIEDLRKVKFVSCKDYIVLLLTSKLATEPSTASSTGYFNTFTLDWDDDILSFLGISRNNLPEILSPYTVIPLKKEISDYLELPRDVGVVMGLYDGGAVALASGVFGNKRRAVVNLGTTGMVRVISERPFISSTPMLKTQTLYLCNGRWFPGGSVNNAGSVIEWLSKVLRINLDKFRSHEVKPVKGLLFHPYITGERGLEFGSEAKGMIQGLEYKISAEDILTAALEGISFTLRMMVEPLIEKGIGFERVTVSGGGTKLKQWLYILANVLKKEVEVSRFEEPALVGSTMLGGVSLGWFDSLNDATNHIVKEGMIVTPDQELVETYDEKFDAFLGSLKRMYIEK